MRRNDFWGAGFYVLLAAATVLLCASGGLGRFKRGQRLPAYGLQCLLHILSSFAVIVMEFTNKKALHPKPLGRKANLPRYHPQFPRDRGRFQPR